MNHRLLDPWLDAAAIAARLQAPDSRLILILGAESWCARCAGFKPRFAATAREDEGATWLWLDLEDHAEFLDAFVPDDLPLLIVYRGEQLTHAHTLDTAAADALRRALAGPGRIEYAGLPPIRGNLLAGGGAAV